MTRCDNCGRAAKSVNATTFPNSDVVICERAGCANTAARAALLYYETDTDDLRGELGL